MTSHSSDFYYVPNYHVKHNMGQVNCESKYKIIQVIIVMSVWACIDYDNITIRFFLDYCDVQYSAYILLEIRDLNPLFDSKSYSW